MIRINRLFFSFFIFCSISLFAMELKEEGPDLPEINLAFFGLNRASRSQFPDCLSLFANALVAQDKLVRMSDECIEFERKIKEIERGWDDYAREHMKILLERDLAPEVEKLAKTYLSNSFLACKSKRHTPIIGTTPRAIAAILIHKDNIQARKLPKDILKLTLPLLKSGDDEVEFLGRFFHFKFNIKRKNDFHDELSARLKKALNEQKFCLEKLEKFKQYSLLLEKYLFAGRDLINIDDNWHAAVNRMINPRSITKEQERRIDEQIKAKYKNVIDQYAQRKHYITSLHSLIIEKLHDLQGSQTQEARTRNKKVKQSKKIVQQDQMPDSLPCLYTSDEEEDLDTPSYVQESQTYSIPDLPVNLQKEQKEFTYYDGEIIEQESDNELTYIADPDNKIKICLYASSCNNRVTIDFPLNYMFHINEWFIDAQQALEHQGYNDTTNKKYRPEDKRFESIQIHRFSRHVDRFIFLKGIQTITPSRRVEGKQDICVTIPGHIEYLDTGERRTCIFVYLIDSATGECYHRNIEFKPEYRLTQEFLEKGYYDINPPLS